MMKSNTLLTLFLTTTLSMLSGAALAADSASSNNGQANAAADAGQVAPDARQNVAPEGVDNSKVNSGSGSASDMKQMDSNEVHKNSVCKDGKCPDINKKVQTGDGTNNNVDTKTDGTTQ